MGGDEGSDGSTYSSRGDTTLNEAAPCASLSAATVMAVSVGTPHSTPMTERGAAERRLRKTRNGGVGGGKKKKQQSPFHFGRSESPSGAVQAMGAEWARGAASLSPNANNTLNVSAGGASDAVGFSISNNLGVPSGSINRAPLIIGASDHGSHDTNNKRKPRRHPHGGGPPTPSAAAGPPVFSFTSSGIAFYPRRNDQSSDGDGRSTNSRRPSGANSLSNTTNATPTPSLGLARHRHIYTPSETPLLPASHGIGHGAPLDIGLAHNNNNTNKGNNNAPSGRTSPSTWKGGIISIAGGAEGAHYDGRLATDLSLSHCTSATPSMTPPSASLVPIRGTQTTSGSSNNYPVLGNHHHHHHKSVDEGRLGHHNQSPLLRPPAAPLLSGSFQPALAQFTQTPGATPTTAHLRAHQLSSGSSNPSPVAGADSRHHSAPALVFLQHSQQLQQQQHSPNGINNGNGFAHSFGGYGTHVAGTGSRSDEGDSVVDDFALPRAATADGNDNNYNNENNGRPSRIGGAGASTFQLRSGPNSPREPTRDGTAFTTMATATARRPQQPSLLSDCGSPDSASSLSGTSSDDGDDDDDDGAPPGKGMDGRRGTMAALPPRSTAPSSLISGSRVGGEGGLRLGRGFGGAGGGVVSMLLSPDAGQSPILLHHPSRKRGGGHRNASSTSNNNNNNNNADSSGSRLHGGGSPLVSSPTGGASTLNNQTIAFGQQ